MISIKEAQQLLVELIASRTSIRQISPISYGSPFRTIGEQMLNRFALELAEETTIIAQNEHIEEELVETLLNTLALAGLLGIDLEGKLQDILSMMDNVVAEAS